MGIWAVQYPNRYFASLTILLVHIFSADYLEDVLQATRTRAEMHVMNYATKCVIINEMRDFLSLKNQVE